MVCSPQSVSPKQMENASEILGESWSTDFHPAVCRPHRACFWISDQKLQRRPPLNHGLPNICCHIALNNLFVDATGCMYPSLFLSWAHLRVCACVCVLVSLENKMLQSTATTTTTKWSAVVRNHCAVQIKLGGIVHSHKHTQTDTLRPTALILAVGGHISAAVYIQGSWHSWNTRPYFSSNMVAKWHISLEWFRQTENDITIISKTLSVVSSSQMII